MSMAEQATPAEEVIRGAIEELYRVFARYSFHPDMPHCEHCVEDDEIRQLGSKPLRELMPDELSRYGAKALTTWGGEDDYRHFLPRMFEIVGFEGFSWPDAEIVLGRLNDARWHAWPRDEQEAVTVYLGALWRWHLCEFDESAYLSRGDILCAIGRVIDDLSPYLRVWEEAQSLAATRHIAYLVMISENVLPGRRLGNGFWSGRQEQEQQVATWLTRPEILTRLEQALPRAADRESTAELRHAIDVLSPPVQSV
jgi:hypothetical protein